MEQRRMVVRRVLNAVGIAVAWLAVAVSVLITVFAIVSARVVDRRDRGLFGYRFFICPDRKESFFLCLGCKESFCISLSLLG